jgi:hypothetical protein
MNWKGILRWIILGLATWLILSLVAGLIFGVINPEAKKNIIVYALGGMLGPFLFFFVNIHYLFGLFASSSIIWAFLSKRFTSIENGKFHNIILLLFSSIIGIIVWIVFPFDRSLAIVGAVFTVLSILLPRLISKKLIAGTFIAA